MRVLLTGASGFVGGAILHTLLEAGHDVVAAARRAESRPTQAGLTWREADFTKDKKPEDWLPLLKGVDAVVNAVGIIRETRELKFQALHASAPRALFEAARQRGTPRIVQISAHGVKEESPHKYYTSKFQADAYLLAECPERSVILRPSLVFGREGEATQQFLQLASLPVVPIVGTGRYEFRPIHVSDLAALVRRAVEAQEAKHGVFPTGGKEVLSLREVFLAMRAWKKGATSVDDPMFSSGPTMNMPLMMMKMAAWGGDLSGMGPMDSDMLGMLTTSEAPDITRLIEAFRFTPRGLREYICANPLAE